MSATLTRTAATGMLSRRLTNEVVVSNLGQATLDLQQMILAGGGLQATVNLPAAARESFLEGTWDATGLLLDRYGEVDAVAARLPYLNGWNDPSPAAEKRTPRATGPRPV